MMKQWQQMMPVWAIHPNRHRVIRTVPVTMLQTASPVPLSRQLACLSHAGHQPAVTPLHALTNERITPVLPASLSILL